MGASIKGGREGGAGGTIIRGGILSSCQQMGLASAFMNANTNIEKMKEGRKEGKEVRREGRQGNSNSIPQDGQIRSI